MYEKSVEELKEEALKKVKEKNLSSEDIKRLREKDYGEDMPEELIERINRHIKEDDE